MLQVEASHVSSPDELEVRFSLTMPPQPQNARLAPPLAPGQSLELYQHDRPDHDGQRSAATTAFMRPDLRMHLRPGTHAHRPVAGVLACVLRGGLWPGARIRTLHPNTSHLWSVAR